MGLFASSTLAYACLTVTNIGVLHHCSPCAGAPILEIQQVSQDIIEPKLEQYPAFFDATGRYKMITEPPTKRQKGSDLRATRGGSLHVTKLV